MSKFTPKTFDETLVFSHGYLSIYPVRINQLPVSAATWQHRFQLGFATFIK
jgi:hypothetical protein